MEIKEGNMIDKQFKKRLIQSLNGISYALLAILFLIIYLLFVYGGIPTILMDGFA